MLEKRLCKHKDDLILIVTKLSSTIKTELDNGEKHIEGNAL